MAHGILVPQPGIESTILTPRPEKSHLLSGFQIGFLGALGFLRESQGRPQWSMEKLNYLQLNQSSSSFICFIYWGCAKAFVQYKDSAMGKKRGKNRKGEQQQTYHYMPFCLQRCHWNIFFWDIFTAVPLQSLFWVLKECSGRRLACGSVSGFSAGFNCLERCVCLGSFLSRLYFSSWW